MTAPIHIRRPKVVLQPLDAAGAPTGSPVDVSCDITAVELSPDQSIDTVKTFCGVFRVSGDVVVSCTVEGVVTPDTSTNWSALVGDSVQVRIHDKETETDYRMFTSEVPFDPSLYGSQSAEENVRTFELEFPVLSDVEWVTA